MATREEVFTTAGRLDLDPMDGGLISYEDRDLMQHIVTYVLFLINLTGVATNVINIRVFLNQGVRNDSITITFLSLSIFDFLSSFFLLIQPMCFSARYAHGMPEFYSCLAYATIVAQPHAAFQFSSTWATVYMAVMKSCNVVFPLKSKTWFTPKFTTISLIVIGLIFIAILIPYALLVDISWEFNPAFNQSVAALVDTDFSKKYLICMTIISTHALSGIAVVTVFSATTIMIYKLILASQWRQKAASVGGSENRQNDGRKQISSRDLDMMKSVVVTTGIFLVCVLVGYIPAIAIVSLPGVEFGGVNENLYHVLVMCRFVFSAINQSVNFFFYIRVSSRYKSAFAASFPRLARRTD